MQIRTGLTLLGGIGIGIFAGMCVTEEKKTKIIDKVKGRIIFALTGEEWPKKRNQPVKRTTYSGRYKYGTEVDEKVKNILTFDTSQEAEIFLRKVKERANSYGYVSVWDMYVIRERYGDFTLDVYRWTKDEIHKAIIAECAVILPKPKLLKE